VPEKFNVYILKKRLQYIYWYHILARCKNM